MAVLISALLAIFVVAVILYPFLKGRLRPGSSPAPDSPAHHGRGGREQIYESIRTLQLEYELGSIEEGEYNDRLRSYRLQAASALREQGEMESELDQALEDEIGAARATRRSERGSHEQREGAEDEGPHA